MIEQGAIPWAERPPAIPGRGGDVIERARRSYGPARAPNHPPEPDKAGEWAGRHPPFDGTDALTHGARSPGTVAKVADAIEANLLEETERPGAMAEWLRSPMFSLALRGLCEAEARRRLYATWLDEHGHIDPDTSESRPATRGLEAAERAVDRKLNDLGLTPRSAAALAVTLRASIVSPIQAEVHPKIREAAERARLSREPEPPAIDDREPED